MRDLLPLDCSVECGAANRENTGDIRVLVSALLQPSNEGLLPLDGEIRNKSVTPVFRPKGKGNPGLLMAGDLAGMPLPVSDKHRRQGHFGRLLVSEARILRDELSEPYLGLAKIVCAKRLAACLSIAAAVVVVPRGVVIG
ncbi:hypothetical protein [Chelativorans sp. J32]|uniref:hypothetical protein n=1 Tax=Chelativorans sp. J32 TaxID=935840 RepID=UPI00048978E9|nr:hypothetical protein [Chelativorans sp. J32]